MAWLKPNIHRIFFAGLMVTVFLGLAGCTQPSSETESQTNDNTTTETNTSNTQNNTNTTTTTNEPEQTAENPVANPDQLVVDALSQPETLDPSWSFFTADSFVLKQVYENLIDYDGGDTGSFVPELAIAVPSVENGGISEDLLTYRFEIRDGVTFWDGSALTCADAEYSFERTLAMDRSGGPTFLLLPFLTGSGSTRDGDGNLVEGMGDAIANAVSCDGNTLVFQLMAVFPVEGFFSLMSGANFGPIYSKAYAIENGAADNADPQAFLEATNNPAQPADTALFDTAMGSGPYKLVEWDQAAQQVIMTAHDDYRSGASAIKNVIYSNVPEFNTRLLRLTQGDADVSYLSDRSQTQQLRDAAPEGVRLMEFLPGFATESIHFNQAVRQVDTGNQFVGSGQCDGQGIPADFFADINVRKAFSSAFDQASFINDFLEGAGVVAALPVPPQIQFVDASVNAFEFDLDAAEAAFKEATCGDTGNSVWDTGFSFTAIFNEGNARRQAALQQLEYNIELLNARREGLPAFNIDVISQPSPVVLNGVFQSQTLPMFVFGWSPDFIDIDNWIRQWMDASTGTWASVAGTGNISESAKWSEMLNTAVSATDAATRTTIYSDLYKDYINYAVAITLPNRSVDLVERTWINGNFYNPAGGDPQLPPDLYLLSKIANGKINEAEMEAYDPVITEF